MTRVTRKTSWVIPTAAACLFMTVSAPRVGAVQIQDFVRPKGSETSRLVGMGLVVGLPGTGDGGKYGAAIQAVVRMTRTFLDANTTPVDVSDSKNVAVVYLEAMIPATGVREGDKVDVHVSAVGRAKSLKGGRLVHVPLVGPLPGDPVFAFAGGAISIQDPELTTVGVIQKGAQLTEDIRTELMDSFGRITLVIDQAYASWPVAHNVASYINGIMDPEGPEVARAEDQKNVVVDVPMNRRDNPGAFVSQILRSYIDQDLIRTGARVLINERTGQIIIGAEVEIAPVIISARGLTIRSLTPPPQPTPENPQLKTSNFLKIDPASRGGTKLGQLMKALEHLQVPTPDRINILKEMHRHGSLNAKLIIE